VFVGWRTRQDQDGDSGCLGITLQLPDHLVPRHPGHVEVQHHDGGVLPSHFAQCLFSILGGADPEASGLEGDLQGLKRGLVVVDQQDLAILWTDSGRQFVDAVQEGIAVDRLGQEPGCPHAEDLLAVLDDRQDHHRHALEFWLLLQALKDLEAVHVWQHDVQRDHVRAALQRFVQGLLAVARLQDPESFALQDVAEKATDILFIVHDQDRSPRSRFTQQAVGKGHPGALEPLQRWEDNPEGAPPAFGALDAQFAGVGMDDAVSDREPQSSSLDFAGLRGVHPAKLLEDDLQGLLGNPDASVLNGHLVVVLALPGGHADSSAFGRELDRIADQVRQHLDQLVPVAPNQHSGAV